ncbi:MAG: hypothetical protein HQL84_11405 [Magnetococcales bacterium]|nr:hypothetical protein [Magnetococcales bacterium]MBF0150641.1 hypothetical protein [Magnetococcales bacterium]MBF0347974.1 hypothetical protein [Magnetococcales bacterium]
MTRKTWSDEELRKVAAQVWESVQSSESHTRWEELHQQDRDLNERNERNMRMNQTQLARTYV